MPSKGSCLCISAADTHSRRKPFKARCHRLARPFDPAFDVHADRTPTPRVHPFRSLATRVRSASFPVPLSSPSMNLHFSAAGNATALAARTTTPSPSLSFNARVCEAAPADLASGSSHRSDARAAERQRLSRVANSTRLRSRVRLNAEQRRSVAVGQVRRARGLPGACAKTPTAMSWMEAGRRSLDLLQKGVRLSVSAFRSAEATLPDTQDGHPRAGLCDAAGACEAPDGGGSIGSPRMTLAAFRRVAEHRFVLQVSRSFKAREDQSLRAVVILVADTHHHDPQTQADLAELVKNIARPGDRLLIEQPHDNELQCKAFSALEGTRCHGIDSTELSVRTAAAYEAYYRALAREVNFAMKAVWQLDPLPSFQDCRALGHRLPDYVAEYKKLLAGGYDARSPAELERLKTLERDRLAKDDALQVAIRQENPGREAHFLARLREHAQEAGDASTFAILGLTHVDAMKREVLDGMDSIVVYPKRRL
ncbi:MAG: hypothetical protein EOO24_04450 [Comamonadaceae bacterium]|nr:MAG: hypothetical protein EOO24_04450 [Comamonadaceae bacterium]